MYARKAPVCSACKAEGGKLLLCFTNYIHMQTKKISPRPLYSIRNLSRVENDFICDSGVDEIEQEGLAKQKTEEEEASRRMKTTSTLKKSLLKIKTIPLPLLFFLLGFYV